MTPPRRCDGGILSPVWQADPAAEHRTADFEFARYHALGNDYLVLDPACFEFVPTPDNVRRACDRHFGIGADGIVLGPIGPVEAGRPVLLQLFNSDGTDCERSGNGLRIFALYLAQRYAGDWLSTGLTARTVAGDSAVRVLDVADGLVRIDMGVPSFEAGGPRTVRLADREVRLNCLNNGNPHAVTVVDRATRELACELGPQIATHASFPERTNVQLLEVLDRNTIAIEIWERGAGYTLSSGSSSCAAAAVARTLGLVDDQVQVRMPGGDLQLSFADDGAISMTGTVELIATGSFGPLLGAQLRSPVYAGAEGSR